MSSIIFLEKTFGNYKDDIVELIQETDSEIYYYDEFERYVYMLKSEKGILWEWADPREICKAALKAVE